MHTKRNYGKRRQTKTVKTHCEHGATMHGLHMWYVNMFEKLGWMVLAKQQGDMEDKISTYKHSLYRLKEKLECKLESVREYDRKQDLKIMWENLMVLIDHANKDL